MVALLGMQTLDLVNYDENCVMLCFNIYFSSKLLNQFDFDFPLLYIIWYKGK